MKNLLRSKLLGVLEGLADLLCFGFNCCLAAVNLETLFLRMGAYEEDRQNCDNNAEYRKQDPAILP